MANIPIRSITLTGTPTSSSNIVFDDGQMKKGTVGDLADAVRPVASQAESEAGSDNAKTMTALRVKQSVASEVGVSLASKSQGDLASSALQPSDIGTSVQAYDVDLDALSGLTSAADKLPYFTGSGTAALAGFTTFGRSLVDDTDASSARTTLGLGTAATTAATDFATAAQGALADSAVQPGDLGALASKDAIAVPTDITATGTPSATTYLRGDGTWATPAGGGSADPIDFDTIALASAASIPSDQNIVRTAGYTAAGDGGAALYVKVGSEPSHAFKFQSADGAWWEIAETILRPAMLGIVGDGTTDVTSGLTSFCAALSALNRRGDFGGSDKTYKITAPILLLENTTIVANGAFIDMSPVSTGNKSALFTAGAAGTSAGDISVLTANSTERSLTVTLTTGGGAKFSADEEVFLTSDDNYPFNPGLSPVQPIGEFKQIKSIAGDVVTFTTPLLNTYNTSANATLRKVAWIDRVHISGLQIFGAGIDNNGQRGIVLSYARHFSVTYCKLDGQPIQQIELSGCLHGKVLRNTCDGVFYNGVDGSNFYGIALYSGTQDVLVAFNQGERHRHLVVTGAWSAGSGYWGEPVLCTVAFNQHRNAQAVSLATDGTEGVSYAYEVHTVGSFMNWIGNSADGCWSGMNIKGGRGHLISGLIVRNYAVAAVSFVSPAANSVIRDVLITGVQSSGLYGPLTNWNCAAILFNPASGATFKNIKITGSQFANLRDSGDTKGLAVYAPAATYVDCEIDNCLFDAGSSDVADVSAYAMEFLAAHGWKVRNNTIIGYRLGIWLNASNDCTVTGNTLKQNGSTQSSGVGMYIKGDRNVVKNNITEHIFRGFEIDAAATNTIITNNLCKYLSDVAVKVNSGATGTVNRDNDAI